MKRWLITSAILLQALNCFGWQQSNFSSFVYHRFGDDRYPSTNIDEDKFEAQLRFFKRNNYQVLSMSQALKRLDDTDLGSKVVVITIDDAYNSFHENGWPLLKKYGFSATLYLNTSTVGSPDFMNWRQINEVSEAGIEIGNHSHAHPYFLNNFSAQDFLDDLETSHLAFKQGMSKIPATYAYPYGEWNDQMATILDSIGYNSAVAQNSGVISKRSDRYGLPRFPMSNDYADMKTFQEKLSVNALEIEGIEIRKSGSFGKTEQPTIILTFSIEDYDIEKLQVFIQGNKANKSVVIERDGIVKLTISPKSPIRRRRTLFTVTVPNRSGEWSWYSYSWVIPSVKQ